MTGGRFGGPALHSTSGRVRASTVGPAGDDALRAGVTAVPLEVLRQTYRGQGQAANSRREPTPAAYAAGSLNWQP